MRFTGKTVVITGGSRGQGAAEAKLFAQHGANVIVADVLDDEGGKLVAEIRAAKGTAEYRHLDVANEADWLGAIRFAHERFKGLHVLVNNAGVALRGKNITATTREDWNHVLGINLTGPFLGIARQSGGCAT
jgi:3alpha(or 20beta)-hydroxysteroid dehydrogenase